MNLNSELVLVFLALALTAVCAEFVPPRPCPYADPNTVSNCTVNEVYINPCKEIADSKPCKLKRGITSNMTIHFTPNFTSDTMTGRVFWASQLTDIPFLGMDANACLSTTCPVKAGERNTFFTEIPILKKYPVRMYDLKWRIWNDQNQECCFMYQIKITK
ncbi:MD-2-related lipid-recognition protein [Megalopta genalis]|uniref:MD-2-related lipid-recognition protein n=1 Tax=Megalopta genalis TaxID=115081 RepID=UPI0014435357|nr:MD-2-related lipid-recognition protein-like isoform X1 [Megalopta genalis]